ncbi:MAG: branched-chain amino acid ABC transporter substrate-binding protein [Betaproteobacteria bacterium]|nr:MAG: branched-chain amino acid ABC transporter substrate-binding protein [Betaproteobacteria bacterium]
MLLASLIAASAAAQTVKIGVVNTFSGPNASFGELGDKAMKLYMKLHANELPAGVKLELVTRDDGGPNPDKAKQLAQELIVRDKVSLVTGAVFTPNALAIAPLATEAKIPFLVINAGTSVVTTRSPYIVRDSFTLWQSSYPLGQWAAKKYKRAYTLVSDYGPGHDAEAAFTEAFKAAGGQLVGSVRVPLQNPDFAPYMQRVKDAKPDALMVFIPAGKTATSVMKTFADLGLASAGVHLIGPGDITTDEELPNMGDVALGVMTVFHYSAAADRPANKRFVEAWKKEYGANSTPNFAAVAAWDGMAMIYTAIREQKGKLDPERTLDIFKHWKNPDSPRGPIAIDPETRDIVQNEYLREVRKVNGQLANVEIETVAQALKDPWKELKKGK